MILYLFHFFFRSFNYEDAGGCIRVNNWILIMIVFAIMHVLKKSYHTTWYGMPLLLAAVLFNDDSVVVGSLSLT